MTTFKGHKTGFKPGESNDCCPNEMGPPSTKFGGRPSVPAGPLERYPGATANISGGNRRLAKSNHGAGEGDGVSFTGRGAFSESRMGSKSKAPGMDGKRSRGIADNKK